MEVQVGDQYSRVEWGFMVRLQTWMWIALGAAAGAAAQNPAANCGVQALEGQWPATAQFVSGMNRGVTSGSLESGQEAAWAAYSKISSADWSALEKRYLTRIDNWRGRALTNLPAGGAAFYPFGGPDAANLLAFFFRSSRGSQLGGGQRIFPHQ
jgi:hypothetical protein